MQSLLLSVLYVFDLCGKPVVFIGFCYIELIPVLLCFSLCLSLQFSMFFTACISNAIKNKMEVEVGSSVTLAANSSLSLYKTLYPCTIHRGQYAFWDQTLLQ